MGTKFMGTEITNWSEVLAKEAKEVASRERPATSQIGLRAGVMMYQGQQIPGNNLDCIIIASCTEQRYDTKPFDPNNITPPDCHALSISGEEMVPSPKSVIVQADRCDNCPHFHWAPNPKRPGKNHKACKEKRRLALLPASVLKDGNFKTAELATLSVPTTSVKYWGVWVNSLNAEWSRPSWTMLANISVRPHPQNQFEVNFKTISPIPDEFLSQIRSRIAAAEEILLTPYDASGMMVPGSDPMKKSEDGKQRKF
jgi:hypothetical protein